MTKSRIPAIVFSSLLTLGILLGACSLGLGGSTQSGSDASSSTSSETASEESVLTPNVSYTGVLEEIGVTVYQQGTHKMVLDDGQLLVLESSDANLDLNAYIGKRVEVHGSVQPTVEAGGTFMRVSEVTVLEAASSSVAMEDTSSASATSSSSAPAKKMCGGIAAFPCDAGQVCIDDPSDDCDPKSGGADCSGVCVDVLTQPSSAPASSSVMTASSVPTSSRPASSAAAPSSAPSVSSASSVMNADLEPQVLLMVKQSYDQPSLWTQKYCTSHMAFCVPVHKNWYFKSFGATTSNLWHVEFGMVDISSLGEGAIVLNLVSGSSASMDARDGQIKSQGSDLIGFKDWTDGNHFELIGDARLRPALEYMLKSISAYELAQ